MKAYQKELGHVHLEPNVCICQELVHSRTTPTVNHHAPAKSAAKGNRAVLAWHPATGSLAVHLMIFDLICLELSEPEAIFSHDESKRDAVYYGLNHPKFILKCNCHCDLSKVAREQSLRSVGGLLLLREWAELSQGRAVM